MRGRHGTVTPALAVTVLAVAVAGCGGSGHDATPTAVPPSVQGGHAATGPGRTAGRTQGTGSAPTINGVHPGAERKSAADGTWVARSGNTRVALYLFRGAAALNAPYFCTGTVDAAMRIALTCANGARDRTAGRAALGAGARTLTVAWNGGIEDVFRRK
ncbi:hypothetical protein GCM10023196_088990 [Actinoallomurus vinaceus]|uniref:Lipoprotein n=1 Tax=Actinoallomurus vinaceus TaxID=1080074 RepID=A0ABP8USE6_9ACTN